MTTHELAAALDALAEEPTLCTALSAADVTELRQAARLLRELEAVRVAAATVEYCNRTWADGHGPNGPETDDAWDALRTALRGVGGG